MPSTMAPPVSVADPILRASCYELLAHSFAYPDEERLADLRDAAEEVLKSEASIPFMRLAAIAREIGREALEPVHVSLITFSSSPDCPAFESAYLGGDAQRQTQRMADIAGFYHAFGVDTAEGAYRPDDLSVELGFMGFLCRKEAYALEHLGPPRARQAHKAQRTFLENHLGTWAIVFGRKFASQAPAGHFYALAGTALADWVEGECEEAGIQPQQVSADAAHTWPLPASHGPEFAGDASFVPLEELAER